jgi:hypothetical protein
VQSVDEPATWAEDHRWLLEAAFAAFDRTGEWPLIAEVQGYLASAGEPDRAIAVAQLVINIPPDLGARHSESIKLTVRALAHVPAAARLLDLFVRVMREAVALYPGEGPGLPELRGLKIKDQFQLDELTYRKVSTLVCDEGWFFNGGGGDGDGSWHRAIRAEILQLRDVTDVEGYLDALARYRFGASEIPVDREARRSGGLLRLPMRWLGRRDPSVLDLIVVAVVSGLIVALVVWRLT